MWTPFHLSILKIMLDQIELGWHLFQFHWIHIESNLGANLIKQEEPWQHFICIRLPSYCPSCSGNQLQDGNSSAMYNTLWQSSDGGTWGRRWQERKACAKWHCWNSWRPCDGLFLNQGIYFLLISVVIRKPLGVLCQCVASSQMGVELRVTVAGALHSVCPLAWPG